MPKPYPTPTNLTSATKVVEYANDVTDGSLVILFSASVWLVIFIILKSKLYRNSDSAAIASMLALILNSFLWALGLLAGRFVVVYLIAAVGSFIWMMFDNT